LKYLILCLDRGSFLSSTGGSTRISLRACSWFVLLRSHLCRTIQSDSNFSRARREGSTGKDLWVRPPYVYNMETTKSLVTILNSILNLFSIIGTPHAFEWPLDSPIKATAFKERVGVPLELAVPGICKDAKDLLQKLLLFSHALRPTAAEAMHHEYFAGPSSWREKMLKNNVV